MLNLTVYVYLVILFIGHFSGLKSEQIDCSGIAYDCPYNVVSQRTVTEGVSLAVRLLSYLH
jgi:hypothetical protein